MRAWGSNFQDKTPLISPGLYILSGWGPGLRVVNIIGNYFVRKDAKRNWKSRNKTFLSHFLSLVAFRLAGTGAHWFPPLGYAYDCNFSAICDVKILSDFLPLCACQSDTNGSILHDHAKYVIIVLVKIKTELTSSIGGHKSVNNEANFFLNSLIR